MVRIYNHERNKRILAALKRAPAKAVSEMFHVSIWVVYKARKRLNRCPNLSKSVQSESVDSVI